MSDSYDYIIVGAGSAGCVLADRLSACGRHKVLLIEAGGSDRRFWIRVPVGYAKTFRARAVNWRYMAEADPGLGGREAYWPRGRVIGGSSSINAMAYLRGLPQDFDDWAAAGATGWDWATVRATFEAMETRVPPGGGTKSPVRGGGPVVVSDLTDRMHPFSRQFLDAARQMGWPTPDRFHAGDGEGLAPLHSTVRGGRRWSSADAHLRPALGRSNLRLITNALVLNVEMDQRRAIGVRYRIGDRTCVAHARGEVVLSAGAVNAPQLLQLSGIGPADLLKRHGLEVRHVLAEVGRGLQDHLGISHMFGATEPTLNNILGRWPGRLTAGARYLLARNGPLSVPVNQVGGFVRSDAPAAQPDLQIYCNPMSYRTDASGETRVDGQAGYLLCAQPCRPTSRGEIRLASADPADPPVIQPNSLSTAYDRDMAIRAGRILADLAQTPALRAVTRDRHVPDLPDWDDETLLADFRDRASTVFHPTSTCRMGRSPDTSVLDARLRVHGIGGLRVVDASAFPNVTSGNINAPVMMLATRGAALILEDAETLNRQGDVR